MDTATDLAHPWPDPSLSAAFRRLLGIYRKLTEDNSLEGAYHRLTSWLQDGILEGEPPGAIQPEEAEVRRIARSIRRDHASDWLQRLASLLAMLMHFHVDAGEPRRLVNSRRPGRECSTYPTSPAVARLVGDALLCRLLREAVPRRCSTLLEAERYALRALDFRVLDPSMESGQLLLEVAQGLIRQVERRHSQDSRAFRLLAGALLEKLCCDGLWGIDRNPLAVHAVATVFSLLGASHGLAQLRVAHLAAADAFDCDENGDLPLFDGIVNNPPWGETLEQGERERLRRRFPSVQHRVDVYVPFVELAVRRLQPAGVLALVLPSQVVASRNSAGLRGLLAERTELEQIIIVPRAAFAAATVRSVLLVGRTHDTSLFSSTCEVTVYPLVKSMAHRAEPRSLLLGWQTLAELGSRSWWPMLSGAASYPGRTTLPLGDLAHILPGIQVYCRGKGLPRQTAEMVRRRSFTSGEPTAGALPAVSGRDVRAFEVLEPREHVLFGPWLARPGTHARHLDSCRVFVRELCRRDGTLTAAIAPPGVLPLHGVLTVIPTGIDARLLVALLNSLAVAEYVRTNASSILKVDFQKITVGELRHMPIPAAAVTPDVRSAHDLGPASEKDLALCEAVIAAEERLRGGSAGPAERRTLCEMLESSIATLFQREG